MLNGQFKAGLIGHSIALSRTPRMHMQEGDAQGLSYDYEKIDSEFVQEDLGVILARCEGRGFAGVNITDYWGFAQAFELHFASQAKDRVLLLGAGGRRRGSCTWFAGRRRWSAGYSRRIGRRGIKSFDQDRTVIRVG